METSTDRWSEASPSLGWDGLEPGFDFFGGSSDIDESEATKDPEPHRPKGNVTRVKAPRTVSGVPTIA